MKNYFHSLLSILPIGSAGFFETHFFIKDRDSSEVRQVPVLINFNEGKVMLSHEEASHLDLSIFDNYSVILLDAETVRASINEVQPK